MEQQPNLMPFQELSFNGDTYINDEFLKLKQKYNLTTAIETGSCFYSTTKWLGENFDKVFTVEINEDFAKHGRHKIENMPNVTADIAESVQWLKELFAWTSKTVGVDDRCIFFLDAHWYGSCPLLGELDAIYGLVTTQPPVIVIHDFFTGNPQLGYDEYNGQPFTYEWIKPSIEKIEKTFDCTYGHHFNEHAVGAMRGVIYLYPLTQTVSAGASDVAEGNIINTTDEKNYNNPNAFQL